MVTSLWVIINGEADIEIKHGWSLIMSRVSIRIRKGLKLKNELLKLDVVMGGIEKKAVVVRVVVSSLSGS